jgi:hypothetical protein
MSAISGVIIDIDCESESAPGRDRRRALILSFALCLAIGGAAVGRDSPVATTAESAPSLTVFDRDGTRVVNAPRETDLSLPPNTTDVLLSAVPDRLANEAWPPLQFTPVVVRSVTGLASEGLRPGDYRMVTWNERGNAYWLVSAQRDVADLVRLANSLH